MLAVYRFIIILALLIMLITILTVVFKMNCFSVFNGGELKNRRVKNYSNVLKEQRRREILNAKPTLREKTLKKVKMAIGLSELDIKLQKFFTYSLVFSVLGVMVGLYLRNPILIVILGALTSTIPFLYINSKARARMDLIEDLLPSVMGNIIAQYLHESDIVIAIEKKLDQIPQPLNKYFTVFVNEVQCLNKDTITALKNLAEGIDNYYFKEFIKLAIQAEEQGQQLKYTMVTIPEDMRDVQQEQAKFDLIRKKYNREFLATIIFLPLNLMILRYGYRDYYDLLIYDVRGKISLGIIVLILVIISYKHYIDNKPIKIELD